MKYGEFGYFYSTCVTTMIRQLSLILILVVVSESDAVALRHLGDEPLYNAGLFEGDLYGVDPFEIKLRTAIVDNNLLWPDGVVYYELSETAEDIREYIMDAMEEFHQKTCIRFKPKTASTKDYVRVQWSTGCWSFPGRKGGMQILSIGDGCHYKGTVVHELGHAIGLYHEHSRSNRDDYIEIQWNNIKKGQENQFKKLKPHENNFLGEEFDYKSIMLYDERAFSKDGEAETIKVKQPGIVIGPVWKRDNLSDSDVRRVNRLYECNGEVRPDPPPVPDYLCDFESFDDEDCELGEQTEFQRRFRTLGGRTGAVLLADAKKMSDTSPQILTPYFNLYGKPNGCFSFDYYVSGKDVYYFNVLGSGKDSGTIFETKEKSEEWRRYTKDVTPQDEPSKFRYYIGAFFKKLGGDGIVAIDNVSFKYSACDK